MIPVAIYARYSTEEQDPRSIEDQIRRCTEHATARNLEIVGEFTDAAVSGAHTERAQLRRMLDVATATKRSPFRSVLVDDLSRLSRNIGDFWRVVDDLAGAGVTVVDVQTGMSSDDPNARSMFGMKSVFNDHFLQTVRYQTHRGLQGRAMAGFSTGGSLFGYSTRPEATPSDVEHPRKLWQIDESDAAIVRRIFRMFDEGARSYRAIADTLNREGIAAPRNNGRGRKHGRGWSHGSVRAILTSAKYIGEWSWNTSRWTRVPGKRARRRVARPESEHVSREYPELAIIDRATWDRVQTRMTRHKRGSTIRATQTPYLVSGLLTCGVCGGPMSVCGQKTKNGVRYAQFGCSAHSSRGGSICSNASTISEKKITGALIEALREVLAGPEVQEAFARAFERRVSERGKADKPGDRERTLQAAQRRVTNATRLIVEDPDDLDLRRQRETDKAEVRRIQGEISDQASAATPRAVPDRKALGAAVGHFLDVVANQAPERGREMLASCMTPLVLTPKTSGPDRLVGVGSIDLSVIAAVTASGCSGGRI